MTHQAKLLQETMATIQKAYFASRPLGAIRVHEGNEDASISIDLYNFEGDGKDVCDGLEFDAINLPEGVTPIHAKAYCIAYEPSWVEHPVIIVCTDLSDDTDAELTLNCVPDTTLANITTWLWDTVKQPETRSVWLRLGVTVKGTAEQMEKLFDGDEETLRNLIESKQYELDGNAYIPDLSVESYNDVYGTDYAGEIEFEL